MSDFSHNRNNGTDGADMPRLHPDAVRSWRNEMSATMNEYLSELRTIESALAPHTNPSEASAAAARFRASEPEAPAARPATYTEPPAAAPPTQPSGSPDEQEFDARLANLKKMLAEKLTNAEGND